MSRSTMAAALLCAAGVVAACGGDDEAGRPRPPGLSSGAGTAGGGDGGGGSGGAPPGDCGNGVAEQGEACDGPDLGGTTCQSLGFDAGEVRCSPECIPDASGCSGVEVCQDGRDNDGDGAVDCDDPECDEACADMCAAPVALADPGAATGNTSGHAAVQSSCSLESPGVAYTFTATTTGFLDVVLTPHTDAPLVAELRSACDDPATRVECGMPSIGAGIDNRLTVPVREGDAFYVIVTGADADQAGAFELGVRSRQTACGDGIQDPTEQCDNALGQPDDGCSDSCQLEATEVEPNDTIATANTYTVPFFAAIHAPTDDDVDVDVVRVTVPSGPTDLIAETAAVTSSDCLTGRIDSVIEILDESGGLIVRRDRGDNGLCARAVAPSLAAGDYYVRVSSVLGSGAATFPYRLDVTLVHEVCGDGTISAGEQCDDGNTDALDGCSAGCRFEFDETEPNGTPAQADAYAASWLAEISPAGDVDVIAVSVPGPRSTLHVNVGDNNTEACLRGQIDSYIEILGNDGTTVLASDDDSGVGYCSYASLTDLAAGTYYVRLRAAPLVPDATFFYRLNVTLL
ncbi:pre-peptidase C-terminal domain-containing protein [Sorangium atrum]|uniref:Pre-peptidase C-terminal domain-containing protein n=1 Tax=Sorangium atrum TaxID=2995308 RepID=A0ABT5BSA1_9BACT|nr:pre-peptidase C-terminal domain-containing protein [Sorangium aterium]MDC0676435.1 pre-peptidase C-terminal domain-containing protein [Sorangium aterium]